MLLNRSRRLALVSPEKWNCGRSRPAAPVVESFGPILDPNQASRSKPRSARRPSRGQPSSASTAFASFFGLHARASFRELRLPPRWPRRRSIRPALTRARGSRSSAPASDADLARFDLLAMGQHLLDGSGRICDAASSRRAIFSSTSLEPIAGSTSRSAR